MADAVSGAGRLLTGPTRKYQVTATPDWVLNPQSTNVLHTQAALPDDGPRYYLGVFRSENWNIVRKKVTFFSMKIASRFPSIATTMFCLGLQSPGADRRRVLCNKHE